MHPPPVNPPSGNSATATASRLLLAGARVLPEPLGSGSCFRKFFRRNRGQAYQVETLRHVPADVIPRVGMIVLEYSRGNLEGCGFHGMPLGVLPWLDQSNVKTFDDDGKSAVVADPAHVAPEQTTFILTNRTWQD